MEKYHKIKSIFKRNKETFKFIEGEYSCSEFEYLANLRWIFTEKVDGTNIRIMWDGENVKFGGRTNNAQIPTFLLYKLDELFPKEKLSKVLSGPVCLYGEGYGVKIQKSGGNYKLDGTDFVLFDIRVDSWWLQRDTIESIAKSLEIKTVPIVGYGTFNDAIQIVKPGFKSQWGDFQAEGLVIKPMIDLFNRKGNRIITKMKCKDF